MILIDASVAFKWFVREEGTDEAQRLLLESEGIAAPALIVAEVGNALWKAHCRGAFVDEDYRIAFRDLRSSFAELVSLDRLLERSGEIARALKHPIYDCFYLACAEFLGRPVITADQRLLNTTAGGPWEAHRKPLLR